MFKVCLYDGVYATADKCEAKNLKKTWYLKSDRDGKVIFDRDYLADDFSDEYDSAAFYTWNEKIVIPIGCTVTYQEAQAPGEYQKDDSINLWKTTNQKIEMQNFYNDIFPCKITLRKLSDDGKAPLENVEFKLTFVKESESYINNKFKTYKPPLKEGESITAITDANGYIVWQNLDQGEYQITETKTRDDMTLLKDPINITLPITMTDKDAQEMSAATDKGIYDEGYTNKWYFYEATYEITNTPKFKMPMTGDNGFWKFGFIGFGTIAVLGTGLVIFDKKGKKQKHRKRVTKK